MPLERTPRHAFVGVTAVLFVASAAATIAWSRSMSTMGEMPMPGGWTMSMMWTRMPGQTWPGVAASFLGMWIVMMVAMMLPSIAPVLWRYRQTVDRAGTTHPGWLTAVAGTGYLFVWGLFGAAVFPLGAALATIAMRHPALARAVPISIGVVVLIAGARQLTTWNARRVAFCREARGSERALSSDAGAAWRYGVCLGLHCGYHCAGLMAILLVVGMMDLRVMAIVTAAITAERLASSSMFGMIVLPNDADGAAATSGAAPGAIRLRRRVGWRNVLLARPRRRRDSQPSSVRCEVEEKNGVAAAGRARARDGMSRILAAEGLGLDGYRPGRGILNFYEEAVSAAHQGAGSAEFAPNGEHGDGKGYQTSHTSFLA
jgi:predicted metal-binding membrane protein